MPIIYSKLSGQPVEVEADIFADLEAFESTDRGYVMANFSSKPLEAQETKLGMMKLGMKGQELWSREAAERAATEAEVIRKKFQIPHQDTAAGADWDGLV